MSTIQINKMDFYYNEYYLPVFEDVNLNLDTDWKLGLIGRNGRGKTTLLKLLDGMLSPTSGNIKMSIKTEMFPYEIKNSEGTTLKVIRSLIAPFDKWEGALRLLEEKMKTESNDTILLEYGNLLDEYTFAGGFVINSFIERELRLMCLDKSILNQEFNTLSGGEQTKIQIIALFLRKNRFLLIDEPTNHLDLEGRKTLSDYMKKKSGFIVVSHDRKFIDSVSDHILSINKNNIYIEKGTYSSWMRNKDLRDEFELKTSEKLKREIRDLELASKRSRVWSNDKEKQKIGCRGDKGHIGRVAAKIMKRALATERRINDNLLEKKNLLKNVEITRDIVVKQDEFESDVYLSVSNIAFGYGDKDIVKNLSFRVSKGDRIWIKGANGTGKTTLLKVLLNEHSISSGKIDFDDEIIIAKSSQSPIWQSGFLTDRIEDEGIDKHLFQTVLSYFDIDEAFYTRPIEVFSEGEKKKVDLARSLVLKNHILIWDEPLNYIDITVRVQVEKAIYRYEPTIIFVEHDSYFGETVSTRVINL